MLTPIKNIKIYEAIMDQIKEAVKNGELKRGDKLPSERELSEKLEVSRASVREALKALEMLGLIESRHGEGNFIKTNFEDSLLEPLSIIFLLMGSKNEEIIQLRKIIEPEAAAMAAKNITEDELAEIYELMDEMENTTDRKVCVDLDKKFHYKIVKASGNNLISSIMFSVSSLIEKYIDSSHINDDNKTIIESQHKAIYKAIREHDSEKAFNLLKDHLSFEGFKSI